MSFEVIKSDAGKSMYTVYWPPTNRMVQFIKKIDLFEVMFKTVNSDYAGLILKLDNGEWDVMWVKSDIWFDKRNYTEYIRDMYDIVGLAFDTESEAELCTEAMNKKLEWSILDGSYNLTV